MGGFKVRIVSPKKRLRKQTWHVQILSTNGEILFWSENYENKSWALVVARKVAEALGAGGVEDTEEEVKQ